MEPKRYEQIMFEKLMPHIGHHIVIVNYGVQKRICAACPVKGDVCEDCDDILNTDDVWNVAIECEDCGEVLLDFDNPSMIKE